MRIATKFLASPPSQFLVFPPNRKHTEKQEPKAQLLYEYNIAWTDNVVKCDRGL